MNEALALDNVELVEDNYLEVVMEEDNNEDVVTQEVELTLEEKMFKAFDSTKRLIRNAGKAVIQLKEKRTLLGDLSEELKTALEGGETDRDIYEIAAERKKCEGEISRLEKKGDPESMTQELESLVSLIGEYQGEINA
jgi:hypothetical protein